MREIPSLKTHLPEGFIAELFKDGRIGYMRAKALPENVTSFGATYIPEKHQELLQICEELQIENLEEKFSSKKRKVNINQLYEDRKVKALIEQFLHRKLNRFYNLIYKYDLTLIDHAERKVFLEDIRIKKEHSGALPLLSFTKTQTGIKYALSLQLKDKNIIPSEHQVTIVSDHPGYILYNYNLYHIHHLNGAKIKPFLDKKYVFIPSHLTEIYFKKFILDVVKKVEIAASGFVVEKLQEIKKVSLRLDKDFMEDRYLIDIEFDYGEALILNSRDGRFKTNLDYPENGEIKITQIIRSNQEDNWNEKLRSLGFNFKPNRRYDGPDGDSVLEHIQKNYRSLTDMGFDLGRFRFQDHKLHLQKPHLDLSVSESTDWFDLKGEIVVGTYHLTFSDISEHIKNSNPWFRLPDGTYFYIPEAWMSKYAELVKFANKSAVGLQIQRANYPLLEGIGLAGKRHKIEDIKVEYIPDPRFGATLRPYQRVGVEWMLQHRENGLGACLADDMGLGKTIMTLALLVDTKNQLKAIEDEGENTGQMTLFAQERVKSITPLKALILLPTSLLFNWYAEAKKFAPFLNVHQYLGPKRKQVQKTLNQFDLVLTTYQTALRDILFLQKIGWNYIVLDESQVIKNKESKIFKAVNQLNTKYKLTLSGTPIENSLADLWSQMEFINPGMLGEYSFFKEHYQVPIVRHQDEDTLNSLRELVAPFILRRRKEEVLEDLPPLMQKVEYVTMSDDQEKVFQSEKSAIRNQLLTEEEEPQNKVQIFNALLRLRQIANHPILLDESYQGGSAKYDVVLDKIEEVVKSGHKVLVFSSFVKHLKLYYEAVLNRQIKYVELTGSTSSIHRQKAVNLFQNDRSTSVFFISIKAGGTGLNLTAADYVFILDPWWNPFVEEQALSRAYRIGQDKPVTVLRFIAKDSIEEKIQQLQAKKKVLAAEMIEEVEQIELARSDLEFLLT